MARDQRTGVPGTLCRPRIDAPLNKKSLECDEIHGNMLI